MASDTFFGLDIGSENIKLVELKKTANGLTVQSYGYIETKVDATKTESSKDLEEIANLIRKLMKEAKTTSNRVVLGLPESVVFTRVIRIANMSDEELKTALKWEAEQFIPIPLKEVKYDYEVIDRPNTKPNKKNSKEVDEKEKMSVFFVAVPHSTVDHYLKIMKLASLEPIIIETSLIALVRSLFMNMKGAPTTLVVNIGANTTDICIVSEGNIVFTRSISSGGFALSKAISQELGLEINQAEEYKRSYGFLEDQLEGKIQEIIKPIFDVVTGEIEKGVLSYQVHHPTDAVKRILVCGGSAKIPGLVSYLAQVFDAEVQLGDPWNNIKKSEDLKNRLAEDSTLYAVSVGLAMREIDK